MRWGLRGDPQAIPGIEQASGFPTKLAAEQLRKLNRRQAPSTLEQATAKNLKNLRKARAFRDDSCPDQANHQVDLTVGGCGDGVTRSKIQLGWRPGALFGTHGAVGSNSMCTPTVMREWIDVEPGSNLDPGELRTTQVVVGGGGEDDPMQGVRPDSLSVTQHIEALRPAKAEGLPVPPWLTSFATHAEDGETFWA